MRGIKEKYTVDAFKVCYLSTPAAIEFLSSITYKDDFKFPFKLFRVENAWGVYDNVVEVSVENPNEQGKYMQFGTLVWSEKRKKEDNILVWFEVVNRVFYTPLATGIKDISMLGYMIPIAEELGLTANNITTLDIANDSNVNRTQRIKRANLNDDLITIVNRKKCVAAGDKVPGLHWEHETTQRRSVNLGMRIKQVPMRKSDKNKDSKAEIENQKGYGDLEMKGYRKSVEIEEASHKKYIYGWVGMKQIYRLEMHAKNKHIQNFVAKNPHFFPNGYNVAQLITYIADSNGEFIKQLFFDLSHRMIRFQDVKTGKVLSVFDI